MNFWSVKHSVWTWTMSMKSSWKRFVELTTKYELGRAEKWMQGRLFVLKFVVDATGPRGFLHRACKCPKQSCQIILHAGALYHFSQ